MNKLSQLKANQPLMDAEEIQSTPISSLPKSGVQFLNSPVLANGNFPFGSSNNNSMLHIDASNLSMEPVPQMDQEDEEVILFKPSSSNNVKTDVASPSKARPEPIGSEIRSSPGSQPNNMPPLVTVVNNASVNRGPTGWDMFASQAQPQQQQPFNNNGMPNGAPLSTQVMGGQMYTPFGNYGNQVSQIRIRATKTNRSNVHLIRWVHRPQVVSAAKDLKVWVLLRLSRSVDSSARVPTTITRLAVQPRRAIH